MSKQATKLIEQRWEIAEPIIHQLAHLFNGKRPDNVVDDLVSVGHQAFVERLPYYDGRRPFTTFIGMAVRHKMINWLKANPPVLVFEALPTERLIGKDHSFKSLCFKEEVKALTSEAQEVISLVLNCPAEIFGLERFNRPKLNRGRLRDYLSKAGWSRPKVTRTFKEIDSFVASF